MRWWPALETQIQLESTVSVPGAYTYLEPCDRFKEATENFS